MDETQIETLINAVDTFGIDNQSDIAIEEMSELTKAIIKHRRYHTDKTMANLMEEIADVQIMIWQLIFAYGSVRDIINSKIERLEKRINESKNKQQSTERSTKTSVKARVRKRI